MSWDIKPVAWAVTLPGRNFWYTTCNYDKAVFCHRDEPGSEIIPLYKLRPAFTDEQREAINGAISCCFGGAPNEKAAEVLRGLL